MASHQFNFIPALGKQTLCASDGSNKQSRWQQSRWQRRWQHQTEQMATKQMEAEMAATNNASYSRVVSVQT
jgi:hypothetical protein